MPCEEGTAVVYCSISVDYVVLYYFKSIYVGSGIVEVECIRTGEFVFCNMAMPID